MGALTTLDVSLVDVYVLRGAGASLECLVLRRAPDAKRAGAWETVHGHIEAGESPAEAGRRELLEETGLAPLSMYNLSRVDLFYQHHPDEVALVPVFAAFVEPGAGVRMGSEHDRFEWLAPADARDRFTWPRERRALEDVLVLIGGGNAGPVEDALRVC